jgi:hypothetical protein
MATLSNALMIFTQQRRSTLIPESEFLRLAADDSPTDIESVLDKRLDNLSRVQETSVSTRNANVLPFPLLETRYGLRLKLEGDTFKISDTHSLPPYQERCEYPPKTYGYRNALSTKSPATKPPYRYRLFPD